MADTRNKINYFLEQVQRWLPQIMQDERQRRELENALKRILASGEQERTTDLSRIEAQRNADIIKKYIDYYAGRASPENLMPLEVKKRFPGVLESAGHQSLGDEQQKVDDAKAAFRQFVIDQQTGSPQSEENVQKLIEHYGPEILQKGTSEAIKVSEAAKERPLKERGVAVQEAGIPLKTREVAVSEGQLKARWKELAGQIGDMTAKEAREELSKRGVERRKYQVQLATKKDDYGIALDEDALSGIKSVIAEIKKEEDKINLKHGKAIETDYKAMADEIKARGGTKKSLTTDEKLRATLTQDGWNIEELKKYFNE